VTGFDDRLWRYRARLLKVVDGDTVDLYVDQGFHAYRLERFRLLGVNTPETHAPTRAAGLAAKTYTLTWLFEHLHGAAGADDWPYLLRTRRSDAFGRWLTTVECSEGHRLTADLLSSGHAVPFMEG
jgi:micrococcal nuclease